MKDRKTGASRGFGFVTLAFETEEEKQDTRKKVLKHRMHKIMGKECEVKAADEYYEPPAGKRRPR
jgi:hypothetical protein